LLLAAGLPPLMLLAPAAPLLIVAGLAELARPIVFLPVLVRAAVFKL